MNKLITELQKQEIEELAINHNEALIAYGADMYRSGLIKGAIMASIGAATAITISTIYNVIQTKRSQKSQKLED